MVSFALVHPGSLSVLCLYWYKSDPKEMYVKYLRSGNTIPAPGTRRTCYYAVPSNGNPGAGTTINNLHSEEAPGTRYLVTVLRVPLQFSKAKYME